MRILIAEDDTSSRIMLTGVLMKWGYEPIDVQNGILALEIMQQPDPPKLILLDWAMPEMDGIDVIRHIRMAESSDPPYIILLTAKGDKSSLVEGLDAGANDYIIKPYDTNELQARIRVGKRMLELQEELCKERDARAHEATHDLLTGALNRRAVIERFPGEFSRAVREQSGISLGLCDIDHFKRINDTYGHQTGDEVLSGLVQLINSRLRPYDFLGRWGGEEFVVITPGCIGNDAVTFFERLRESCANTPIKTSSGDITVTISIGIAEWNKSETSEALLDRADNALYQAKKLDRNQIIAADNQEKINDIN